MEFDGDGIAGVLVGGEESKSAMLVCTCEELIEIFGHEDGQSVNVGEGTSEFSKSEGRKK